MASKKHGAHTIPVTNNEAANLLLATDPLALLLGMLLDQQVPMEWAFMGPQTLKDRLGHLDAAKIAVMDPEAFVDICREKPAIHRFPKSMGERVHAVCQHLVEHYDGDAEKLWTGTESAQVVYDRLREIPGYGDEKTKIFLAILVKRFDKELDGFEQVAAPFSDEQPRSVADISSQEAFDQVRAWKKAKKAAGKSKQQ
jgi:uncharacterized HhH-GPD family protein